MGTSLPFVSIIIPTFNRATMLPVTLDSFLAQDYPRDRYEIIIANNNSTDTTPAVIDAYCRSTPLVRSITEARQGVHYARNSAAKTARGDLLYFTDDDMVAEPALIREIVAVFQLDPLIASATGKIIGRFDVPPPPWVKRHLINQYLSLTDEGRPDETIISENDLVYSCHQAVTRPAFFRCGGFNPENTAGVWIGDGETGLGIKLKQAGYKFAYTPRSVIYHMIPPSRTTLGYLIRRIGNQGNCDAYTEYRKHRDKRRILRDLFGKHGGHYLHLLKWTLKNVLQGRESWHFIPAQLAYVYRRIRYDLRLCRDAEFRKLVEVDDWISYEG
ncbi:MAG TPA: glycosyltransferase [Desulfuromonadaceae bacterium]